MAKKQENVEIKVFASTKGQKYYDMQNEGQISDAIRNHVLPSAKFEYHSVKVKAKRKDDGSPDYLIAYMFEGGPAPMDCVCGNPAIGECDENKSRNLEIEGLLGEKDMPTKSSLSQNHPNPFNPKTTISFSLPTGSDVRLEIFNIRGQFIREVRNEVQGGGRHFVTVRSRDLPTGIYIYRLVAGDQVRTRKFMIVK